MANSTQFRQYHISQSAEGGHIEVVRNEDQVAVLAFDGVRQQFVVCRILLKGVFQPNEFVSRVDRLQKEPLLSAVKVLETGEDDGNQFYVTELVDGETLGEYLSRQSQIPCSFAWHVVVEAMETALDLVKLGDFVSRDPLNAFRLLPQPEGRLWVKASDFHLNPEVSSAKSPRHSALKAELKGRLRALQEWLEGFHSEPSKKKKKKGRDDSNDEESHFKGVPGPILSEHLETCLQACVGGVEVMLEEWLGKVRHLANADANAEKGWEKLEVDLQPQSLLAGQLPSLGQLAQIASQQVKVLSQKEMVDQPYSLWGVTIKSSQPVLVEALPGVNLTGDAAMDAMEEVRHLHKTGKYPNLVPLVFVEEQQGLRCVAEAAVNGVPLKEMMRLRGRLDVQETYLVLAGLDVALSQLEKAKISVRRLRVDDVYLFTGKGADEEELADLMNQKLGDWPGFSVVLRVHNSLHSMGGRGEDPAALLPLKHGGGTGVEPLWHGGWMAALGGMLAGRRVGSELRPETGVAEVDTVFRLLDDELERASRGEASARAAFLARYARVMQQFHLAQFTQSGGFWTELSGSLSAQDRAAQVSEQVAVRPATRSSPPPKQTPQKIVSPLRQVASVTNTAALPGGAKVAHSELMVEDEPIGFAEMLIGQQLPPERVKRSFFSGREEDEHYDDEAGEVESSWVNMREERSFITKLLMLLVGSLIIGAVLAHWSGRAVWQSQEGADSSLNRAVDPKSLETKPEPVLNLPVPKQDNTSSTPSSQSNAAVPASSGTPPNPVTANPNPDMASAVPAQEVRVSPQTIRTSTPAQEDDLTKRLRTVREQQAKLSSAMLMEAERAANAGNAEAMLAMAQGLLNGDAGRQDDRAAIGWLEKAVDAGHGHAITLLADCYFQGRGVEVNALRGVQLLEAASNLGVPEAKDKLSVCYAKGLGVMKDDDKAFRLSMEAYRAGVPAARNNLGAMYLRGQGTAPDAARAVQLFTEGAELGHAESMLALAQCLEYGKGTRADLAAATQWYRAAARKGSAEAMRWCREKQVAY